jgi:23S rRNA (uracil1939-C5)-methyltransferase
MQGDKRGYICGMVRKALILEDIRIEKPGSRGKGIGYAPDGKVVFVPYGVPGDLLDVRVIGKKKRHYEGKIQAIKEASPDRVEARCEHFGQCGGCKWQHVPYPLQLKWKEQEVFDHLERLGGFKEPETEDILGSQHFFHYRNKMEYSFKEGRWLTDEEVASGIEMDRRALGFHAPGRWDRVIDIHQCHLQDARADELRNTARDLALEMDMSFYEPREKTGEMRSMIIRNSSLDEWMVVFMFGMIEEDRLQAFMKRFSEAFPWLTSLQYTINHKVNDAWFDLDIIPYKGADFITEEMEVDEGRGLKFRIGAKTFYQTNAHQAQKLYALARSWAGIEKTDLVYDLYTGTGTIALFLSDMAEKIVGIESVKESIDTAKENARNNGIDNVDFHCGDMRKVLDEEFMAAHGHPDVVITDPPREGMHKDVTKHLLNCGARTIVYISCNSATQARDMQILSEKYELVKSRAVDMFPHTFHVENVSVLRKR